ncbi:EAL domain-containing protein [Crenobacter sp. SG2305]|uniref:EAL domain-containing protein n=1 Tax=Crenobacter oryzisoli TaxID=3056844 RepID=UPI0025AB1057|nr:EAL domain-containing protein [Crenobacter sp. SG2305]MDN0085598.1 EAL domain-containing protein [Crenobacter sp. SG2305]
MNRFRKHIGTLATPYGIAIGMASFWICIGASLLFIAVNEQNSMAKVHEQMATLIRSISVENEATLGRLNQQYRPDCIDSNLVHLRTVLFSTRFIRDIGIYDDQNRLICSTTEGRFLTPFDTPTPSLREIRNGVDQSIWFDIPILLGSGQYHAMVVRQGRFNVAINQDAISSLLGGMDILGLQLADSLPTPVFISSRTNLPWQRYFNEQSASSHPTEGYDWRQRAFVRTDYVKGTPWVLQSYRTLTEVIVAQAPLASFLVSLSALLGLLITALVIPTLKKQKEVSARVYLLLREGGILCLYQPIIDLSTRHWVGCEVLMRLRDGADLVPPDQAIPAILEQKLAWQLDAGVIEKGLKELAGAMPPTSGFKIAFNLFPENISFNRINDFVQSHLAATGRDDFQIDFEVIEQSYDESVIREIARLKQSGYRVSVDDFGTGYSNLGRVKRLAPDLLKIDRSFVFEMEDDSLRSSLIPEIIGIARAIGSQVVAEGIENAQQAEQLRKMGVEYGQGYYFAKPMPIQDFVSEYAAQADKLRLSFRMNASAPVAIRS